MRLRPHHIALAVLTTLGLACSTPSVPLPPPEVDPEVMSFAASTTGQYTLSSTALTEYQAAQFFIIEQKTGDGVIVTAAADGSFTTPPFAGAVGDTVDVYFVQPNGTQSSTACIPLDVGKPLVNTCPSPAETAE